LPYIDAVIRESLRLNPTAPAITLVTREDTIWGGGGYLAKEGEPLLCRFHNIHLDKKVYGEDADERKLKRILEENFQRLPKMAHVKHLGLASRDAPEYGYLAMTVTTLDSALETLAGKKGELVVIFTCSYDGLPADNAAKFCDWLN
ncbi:hypothetical protein OIDMADRAFT_95615, partial [Oidiodendron maius Zn]